MPLDPRRSRLTDAWWGVHVARYVFASEQLVRGCDVLDIACGAGYGTALLAVAGHRVVGVDIDLRTVIGARRSTGACFAAGSGEALPMASSSVDAVTSFETIEHLRHPDAFVAELARVIKPGGRLLLSTPNALQSLPGPDGPSNPFHLQEYTPDELGALLSSHFRSVALLGQERSPRFRVSPFHVDQQRLPKRPVAQARLLGWKLLNRVPAELRSIVLNRLLGRDFLPGEHDYEFRADLVDVAPVVVAVAER